MRMTNTQLSQSILLLVCMTVMACSPKAFETNSGNAPQMSDRSEMIPEAMSSPSPDQASEGLSIDASGIVEGSEGGVISGGPGADKIQVTLSELQQQLAEDPALGYKVVAVIDRAKEKTSETAQSLTIFKLNEETKKFERFNAESWKVSTGVQIPITETITNSADGTTREVTSKRFTPTGFFAPNIVEAKAKSRTYDSEMPNAVWFWRESGYAIHATGKGNYSKLGRRASHGCIRLTLENSKAFYTLVGSYGRRPVIELNRLTGKPVLKKDGTPSIVKRYPTLVVIIDPTDKRAVKLDLKSLAENPESVQSLFE
jgi:hypothetical protein